MPRIKRGTVVKARHNKILKLTKGYKLGRNNLFRQAKQALLKAGMYAYRDRKVKKRDFRGSWIVTINAAAREQGLSYSQFMYQMKQHDNTLNRKVLAEIARTEPETFTKLVESVKK